MGRCITAHDRDLRRGCLNRVWMARSLRVHLPAPKNTPMRARIFFALFLGFLALAAAGFAGGVAAQPYGRPYGRDGIQPLDRLLPGIRRQHPGNFYDAEGPTYGPSGDPHYHLKWMTPDGRVVWFDADARNGRVLRSWPGRDGFDGPRPAMRAPYYGGYGRRFEGPRGGYGPPAGYARPYRNFGRPGGGRWRH